MKVRWSIAAAAVVASASACASAPPVERRTVVRIAPGTTIVAATVGVRCGCGPGAEGFTSKTEVPLPQAPGSAASARLERACGEARSTLSLDLRILEGGRIRLSSDQEPVAEGPIGALASGTSKDCAFEVGSALVKVE